jgi:hypothetical protein
LDQAALASKFPSHALAKLKHLRTVRVFEWSDECGQLETLAKNNDLEAFRIPHYWQAVSMIEILSREPNLRQLEGVRVNEDASPRILEALKGIGSLRELEIHFQSLTDESLRGLSKLTQLERISLSINASSGHVTSEGIAIFQQLPIKELDYSSVKLPVNEEMQRVINNFQGSPGGVVEPQYAEGRKFLLQTRPAN